MAAADLEYLEEVFRRLRANGQRHSFTIIRGAGVRQRTVGENTNNVSVGSKASVDDPPGMNS